MSAVAGSQGDSAAALPQAGGTGRRGWLRAAAWLAGTAAAFAVYLRLAGTRAVNSDGASQALQAWDLLHGNILLHGWTLTDVSFYTTEIPEYLLVELAHGLNEQVVHIAAALTYTLAVLLAALVAKGTATGREAAVRVALAAGIMLAPQLSSGTNVLLSSPDHIGTSVPVLLTWLILDRARPRWWVPVAAAVLLAWSMTADELVLIVAIVPLIAVCAVRVARGLLAGGRTLRQQRYEMALAAGAAAAGVAGYLAPKVIHALGGFYVKPVASGLAPLGEIVRHNLPMTGDGLLLLAGAYFPGLPPGTGTWLVMLHLAGLALAACAIAVTAWRFFRGEDMLPQLLLAGIACNIAAYVTGTHAVILADAREMAPVLPLAAALAGRQLARFLTRRAPLSTAAAWALALVLAGYVAGLAHELTAPQAAPQNAVLTAWLESHPIGTGLSGYWESNVVTLSSGGRDPIRVITAARGRVYRFDASNVKESWYDPAVSRADFIVIAPPVRGYPGFTDRRAAVATFGRPARVYHVGAYTILWWRKNLLATLPRLPRG
jgi:hypothetical protein